MPVILITKESPPELLEQIAKLHRIEIPSGFLTTLGHGFLLSFYNAMASAHSAIFLASINADLSGGAAVVNGFIVGAISTRKLQIQMLRTHGLRLMRALMTSSLLTKRNFAGLFDIFLYPGKRLEPNLPESEIVNFCVRQELQGQGIGRELFSSLNREFFNRGIHKLKIVTGVNQKSAQTFYKNAGATLVGELSVHKGQGSFVYIYEIPQPNLQQ